MRKVGALTHFPPGLLPLMASFLGPDSIFVAGGFINRPSEKLASAICYSLSTKSWRSNLPSMSTVRARPASVALGGRMMVFGGTANVFELATCEAFDPVTNQWTALPPMSTARSDACAVAWQGCAYVFGGWNGATSLKTVECFDSKLNRWFAIAPMTTPRSDAAAVAVPGRGLLVMGGSNFSGILESAELFHPVTNQWTEMTWQLPKPLYNLSAQCSHDGILYIFGGCTSSGERTTECWSMDLTADVPIWSPLPPLPATMSGLVSVMI